MPCAPVPRNTAQTQQHQVGTIDRCNKKKRILSKPGIQLQRMLKRTSPGVEYLPNVVVKNKPHGGRRSANVEAVSSAQKNPRRSCGGRPRFRCNKSNQHTFPESCHCAPQHRSERHEITGAEYRKTDACLHSMAVYAFSSLEWNTSIRGRRICQARQTASRSRMQQNRVEFAKKGD